MAERSILVINCGSSSLKYQLVDPDSERVLAAGTAERIGEAGGSLTHQVDGERHVIEGDLADHDAAFAALGSAFAAFGPDLAAAGVVAVGHRVVHGGETFRAPVIIDEQVLAAVDDLAPLAPLHNPPALSGVRAALRSHPEVPHVAVFDTAFYADLPPEAYTYAIDATLAETHRIRRYGFHGTSHRFVSGAAADLLGRSIGQLNQIVLHLGNGASASAIRGGRAVDTSMGLTPLEGLVMGTRSGDLDPGVPAYLHRAAGLSVEQIDTLLNKRSGLLGLAGVNDFRELLRLRADGDEAASLAFEVYVQRIVKYVGAYLAVLGRVDALVFTAGIGEHNPLLRAAVCERLRPLGFVLDETRNGAAGSGPRVISTEDSPTAVLVIPTNEELAIARDTMSAVGRVGD